MDQVGIRLINSQDIDELKWSQMLSSSPSIFTQYQEIWFLNSICKSWQVFVKGDYEAAFVFSTQKKGGFSLIYQPFFSRCFSFLGFYHFCFPHLNVTCPWLYNGHFRASPLSELHPPVFVTVFSLLMECYLNIL